MRRMLKRLLERLRGGHHRRETMQMLARNREAEARLWIRMARGHPPESAERDEARSKSRQRAEEAKRLRNEAFTSGMNLRGRGT